MLCRNARIFSGGARAGVCGMQPAAASVDTSHHGLPEPRPLSEAHGQGSGRSAPGADRSRPCHSVVPRRQALRRLAAGSLKVVPVYTYALAMRPLHCLCISLLEFVIHLTGTQIGTTPNCYQPALCWPQQGGPRGDWDDLFAANARGGESCLCPRD